MSVGGVGQDGAAAYLSGVLAAHGRIELDDQLAALAEDLGCLALALSQAAAYLVDQALGVADCRALLADRTRTLDNVLPEPGGLPDGQRDRVTAAWSLSVDLAETQCPPGLARHLLELTAVLDPNGIPTAVLASRPARIWWAAPGRQDTRGQCWWRRRTDVVLSAATGEQVYQALRVLDRLGLIDHTPDIPHHAVRVHALIQRTTRDTLTPDQHAACARAAADALLAAWPDPERDTDLAQALRANTAVLADHAGPGAFTSPACTRCCSEPATAWGTPASPLPPATTSSTWPPSRSTIWAPTTPTP